MKKNEKNNVILGLATQEPRNSAESRNCHPRACNARTEELSRFLFNLIRRSLEFFAFAKNRDDSLLFLASPWTRFSEIATSAFRLLAMTPITLALAAVLAMGHISESRAEIASANNCDKETFWNGNLINKSTGTNCMWSITDEGVLILGKIDNTQNAKTGNYQYGSPWEQYRDQIKAVVFDGVETNDGYSLGSLLAGDSVNAIITTGGVSVSGSGTNYEEKRTDCPESMDLNTCLLSLSTDYGCANGYLRKGDTCIEEAIGCGNDLKKNAHCIDPDEGCGDNYLRKGKKCIPASQGCGSSFRLNDGECDRIRYTPAEAAQYLKDTDNEIIMTFKVNR